VVTFRGLFEFFFWRSCSLRNYLNAIPQAGVSAAVFWKVVQIASTQFVFLLAA